MAHNENYVKWTSKNIKRRDYYNYINSIFLTPRTKAFIEECKRDERVLFDGFDRKFACTGMTNGLQYYRKMSQAEYNSFATPQYKDKPLKSACDFTNADLYRVWMSSSYRKCQQFGNENVVEAGDVIVRFRFKKALLSLPLDFQPHQKPGVQNDASVIAVHREGFAVFGNLDADELALCKLSNLDHNVGICRAKLADIHAQLVGYEVMP